MYAIARGIGVSVCVDIPLGGAIYKLYVLMLGSKLDFIRNYQLGPVEV